MSGGRCVVCGGRCVVSGGRCVVSGGRCVVCGGRCVVCGVGCGVWCVVGSLRGAAGLLHGGAARLVAAEEFRGEGAAHDQRVPPRGQPGIDPGERLAQQRRGRAAQPADQVRLGVLLRTGRHCGRRRDCSPRVHLVAGVSARLRPFHRSGGGGSGSGGSEAEAGVGEGGVGEQWRDPRLRPVGEDAELCAQPPLGERERGHDVLAQVDRLPVGVEHDDAVVEDRRGPQAAWRVGRQRDVGRCDQRVAVLELLAAERLALAAELQRRKRRLIPPMARVEAVELVHDQHRRLHVLRELQR